MNNKILVVALMFVLIVSCAPKTAPKEPVKAAPVEEVVVAETIDNGFENEVTEVATFEQDLDTSELDSMNTEVDELDSINWN